MEATNKDVKTQRWPEFFHNIFNHWELMVELAAMFFCLPQQASSNTSQTR